MKKVWCIAMAAMVAFSGSSFAQQQEATLSDEVKVSEVRNEISVWGLGGISSFMYNPAVGSTTPGFGIGGGVGVTRFFNPSIGLRIGAEVMTYSTEFKAPEFTTNYALAKDADGEPFEYQVRFKKYEEAQRALALNVPVMATYERGLFYASLGVKVGFFLNSKSTAAADSIVKMGKYTETNVTYKENLPRYGFESYSNAANIKSSLGLGLNLALSAEVGAKWKMSDKFSLYTGLFADYGLLNVASKKNEYLIDYRYSDAAVSTIPVKNHTFNSVLNSLHSNTQSEKSFTDRVNMLNVGLKIALSANTSTLFASTKKTDSYEVMQPESEGPYYYSEQPTSEEKQQLKAEKDEQEKTAKEQAKAEKEQQKAEKQAAKERAKLTPRQQQMEDDIAELKRVQEILMQQAESSNKNQEAILGAVKAAQDAATAAAEAARAAQTAVMSMQSKDKAAEKKALTAARKDARNLSFKIQISARRTQLENINEPFARFGLDMEISEERYTDDTKTFIYKYVVGSYKSVDDAVEVCNEVREKGIKDAFVVAYYRGKRITMAEAYNLLNRN